MKPAKGRARPSRRKRIKEAIENLYQKINVVDVLVNMQRYHDHASPLVEEDIGGSDVNIKGTLFITKHVLKGMIRNKTSTIVNVGSIAGTRMLDVPITYAMTKAAINGLPALAAEMKRFDMQVNSVIPVLDGGVGQGVPEVLRQDFISHCAAGRQQGTRWLS